MTFCISAFLYFNPRSREGSDPGSEDVQAGQEISIRAPARGATICESRNLTDSAISIRAPARGATNSVGKFQFDILDFNPRSREGSDQKPQYGLRYFLISIRAPARGATKQTVDSNFFWAFQSALPRGERPAPGDGFNQKFEFQSALPRGERHCLQFIVGIFKIISIRAPARGATLCPEPHIAMGRGFQSALPRGERPVADRSS